MDQLLSESLERQLAHLEAVHKATLGELILVCSRCYQVIPSDDTEASKAHKGHPWPIRQVIIRLKARIKA